MHFHQWIMAAPCLAVASPVYAQTPSEELAVPQIRAALANPDIKNLLSIATHEKCNFRIEYKNGNDRSDTCNISLYSINNRIFVSTEIFGNNNTQVVIFGFFSAAASENHAIGQNINGIQIVTNGQSHDEKATGTCMLSPATQELVCNARGRDRIGKITVHESGVIKKLK